MSAFVSLKLEDRVEIISDGAIYLEDGTLVAVKEKIFCHDSLPIAVVGRGNSILVDSLANAILQACSLFGSVDIGTSVIQQIANGLKRTDHGDHHAEILIAFHSAVSGTGQLYFETMGTDIEAYTVFTPSDLSIGGTAISAEEFRDCGLTAKTRHQGLVNCGVAIMEIMRSRSGFDISRPEAGEHFGIGGHVQHVTIDKDCARSKILKTWPDLIGERINPELQEVEISA